MDGALQHFLQQPNSLIPCSDMAVLCSSLLVMDVSGASDGQFLTCDLQSVLGRTA